VEIAGRSTDIEDSAWQNVGESANRFAAVDSTTQTAYVTTGDAVSVVDIESRTVTATITVVDPTQAAVIETVAVGRHPNDVALDPPSRTAFVPNTDDGSVTGRRPSQPIRPPTPPGWSTSGRTRSR
jgi:hypothetical protein